MRRSSFRCRLVPLAGCIAALCGAAPSLAQVSRLRTAKVRHVRIETARPLATTSKRPTLALPQSWSSLGAAAFGKSRRPRNVLVGAQVLSTAKVSTTPLALAPRVGLCGLVGNPGFGQLLPLRRPSPVTALNPDVKYRLDEAVRLGRKLPGDKLPQTSLQQDYAAAVAAWTAAGRPAKDTPVDPARTYHCALIPELARYLTFLRSNAFTPLQAKDHGTGPDGIERAVFDYGCRKVATLLPGLARVVRERVPSEGEGPSWDAATCGQTGLPACSAPPGQPNTPKPAPATATDAKERTIEVCKITHAQMEESLAFHVSLMTSLNVKAPGAPVSADVKTMVERGITPAPAASAPLEPRLSDGRNLSALRPLALNAWMCPGSLNQTPIWRREGRLTRLVCARGTDFVAASPSNGFCQLAYGALHAGPWQVVVSAPIRKLSCRVAPEVVARVRGEGLAAIDLGTYSDRFKGETMEGVIHKLQSYYRHSGELAGLRAAEQKHKDALKSPVDENAVPATALVEVRIHNSFASLRAERALLRKNIERWTAAYEYQQQSEVLRKDASIAARYTLAEQAALDAFWNDCRELRAICDAPDSPRAQAACRRCAFEALNTCLDGEDPKGVGGCRGETVVAMTTGRTDQEKCGDKNPPCISFFGEAPASSSAIPAAQTSYKGLPVSLKDGNTFFNWLYLQSLAVIHDGRFHGRLITRDASTADAFTVSATRKLVLRKLTGQPTAAAEGQSLGVDSEGLRLFGRLPLSPWQRCQLISVNGQCSGLLSDPLGVRTPAEIDGNWKTVLQTSWEGAPLFGLLASRPGHVAAINLALARWRARGDHWQAKDNAYRTSQVGPHDNWTGDVGDHTHGGKLIAAITAGEAPKSASSGEGDIGGFIKPVVGKLLGMLLQAAGLNETMKTLARAAGMTPEQAADCEDPEYRREQMRIAVNSNEDTKRGCLLKVFARNFATVMESIIVMLGNKLVDWGVDLLRTVLQAAKSALVGAAGSVPFVGGALAIAVDLGWELLLNIGAKTLLKSFVISKLPEWLKVREMAKQPFEDLLKNPIVQVVAGTIIELVDAAMAHGDKSWTAIGVDVLLNAVQFALEKAQQWFWVRALSYAKQELAKSASPNDGLGEQAKKMLAAMARGFGLAVARKLDDSIQGIFRKAVDATVSAAMGQSGGFENLLKADPVKTITDLLKQHVAPVVLPVAAAFAPNLPGWAKDVIGSLGKALAEALSGHTPNFGQLGTALVEALVKQLPVAPGANPAVVATALSFLAGKTLGGPARVLAEQGSIVVGAQNKVDAAKNAVKPILCALVQSVNSAAIQLVAKVASGVLFPKLGLSGACP